MPKSPILGGFSTARSRNLADNDLVNLVVEIVETKDGKAPGALYNSAGLDLVGTIGSGPIRGLRDLNDLLYIVSGGNVYSLTPNGISTLCGAIGNNSTPVSMFANTTQLMMVDGVGAWLVPGGYPLTGGVVGNFGGGLYAIGDTITLIGTSGTASASPVITVTGVVNTPVTAFTVINAGTTYNTASGVATTAIQGQPGAGTGLTLNLTAAGLGITAAAVNVGGTSYAVGDTGLINGGTADAVYQVKTVSGGVVTAVILLFRGSAYTSTSGATTTAGPGVPGNAGLGFTVNTTASAGPITAATVAVGGVGYEVGNVGKISGGTGDATYRVIAIGLNGAVTAFTVTTPGALVEVPAAFTQKLTSQSGAGFTLISPSFGAFVSLVPIAMPFANPVMGASSDGFGLVIFQSSQAIAQSDEGDLSNWQPLNFGIANQSPDNCMALAVLHDQAYLIKQRNTEVWVDQGLAGFAFQSLTGVHMEYGSGAPFSLAKAGEVLIFLARNEQGQCLVVMIKGYSIEVISTQALVTQFQSYASVGDAIGYSFQQGGHVFYVLTFPQANVTWQYDLTSSQLAGFPIWNRLGAWSDGSFSRHWGNCFWNWNGLGSPVSTTTPTHRYWRIYMTSLQPIPGSEGGGNPSNAWLLLVQMAATAGGENLIGSGTASASSQFSSSFAPAFAANGTNSGWLSADATVPVWWKYDFGAPTTVTEVRITADTNEFDWTGPQNFQLQYSDNNSAWTTAASFSAATWTGAQQAFEVLGSPPPVGQGTAGVVGDYLTGNLYAFDPTKLTDNGTAKRWRRRWRAIAQGSDAPKRFSSLSISMQSGNNIPPTANPQVMLRWSDDGGMTWSDQRIQAAGRLGETAQTIKFNRLGMTRRFGGSDRFFELTSDDQFQVAIIDAEVDAS